VIGGFANFMEQAEDTARREFKEETGFVLNNLKLVGSLTTRYTKNGSACATIFITELPEDARLTPSDDVAELLWRDIDELHDDDFGYLGIVDVIKLAHGRNKSD